jgi:hypothetical protein
VVLYHIIPGLFILFISETITFYDLNSILLLTVHLNIPSPLRLTLLDRFRASLPGHLQDVDTANDEGPEKSCGQAIHFDWYNRYSTLVSLILRIF